LTEDRKYEGSAQFISTLGTAIAFTVVGIISILFIIFNIDFIGLRAWGFWMFIPAFFIYIGAISVYLKDKRLKNTVIGATNSYQDERVSLDNLSSETLITKNNLLRILMDLRTEGKIKYKYDRENGDLLFGDAPKIDKEKYKEIEKEKEAIPKKDIFCPYCGSPVSSMDKFCFKCGSSLK
jgi:hypothetical protein